VAAKEEIHPPDSRSQEDRLRSTEPTSGLEPLTSSHYEFW